VSRGGPAWRTLGIAPTDDTRAIRRAYAVKLKAIDVDRDPQAFIALREAFEQAQNEAQWLHHDQADDEPEAEPVEPETTRTEADPPEPAPPEPEDDPDAWDDTPGHEVDFDAWERDPLAAEIAFAPPAPNPWGPPTPEDYDDHARALAGLLLGEHAEPWPSPEETEAMLAHWQRITRDPRMQEMSFYADAENWFADLIARAVPFSDPLVGPVADHFDWMRTAGEISQSPAIAYVVRRRQSLDFFDAVRVPGHPLNAAWRELTRPATEHSRRGWTRRKKVHELLATVRGHYPELEANFDSYRVALWEPTEKRGWSWSGALIVWFLIAALHFANSQCQRPSPALPLSVIDAPSENLTDPVADIDRTLQGMYGRDLDVEMVRKQNPRLYTLLETRWKMAKDRKDSWPAFSNSLIPLLNARAHDALADAPLALLRDYHGIVLDRAIELRKTDVNACAAYLAGKDYDGSRLPRSLRDRNQTLMAKLLLVSKAPPVPAAGATPAAKPTPLSSEPERKHFSVPGFLIEKGADRAGLTREQFGEALRYQGPEDRQCNGRIAFLETVLGESDETVGKLLRAM
jgi:hypothetical protein